MKLLGVDYGRKKIGLALGDSESNLSTPHSVIKFEKEDEILEKIKKLVFENRVKSLVVGISEGEMANESRKFGKKLEKNLNLPVYFYNEVLTSVDAKNMAIEAGLKRKKRKNLEDAQAASLILQGYLDDRLI